MNNERPYFRRVPAADQEESAWASFYAQVSDPSLAEELVAYLDADPHTRHRYAGLYVRCRQSLRRERERQMRVARCGEIARRFIDTALRLPMSIVACAAAPIHTLVCFCRDVFMNACDGHHQSARSGRPRPRRAASPSRRKAASAETAPLRPASHDHDAKAESKSA